MGVTSLPAPSLKSVVDWLRTARIQVGRPPGSPLALFPAIGTAENTIMAANRRMAPRYPSWLPGVVTFDSQAEPADVRVVDLSVGGAALEGDDFTVEPGTSFALAIESGSLSLSLKCHAIAADDDLLSSVVRVRFAPLHSRQRHLLNQMVEAMAAEFHDRQLTLLWPGRHRQGHVRPY